jgi:hypothetical protein
MSYNIVKKEQELVKEENINIYEMCSKAKWDFDLAVKLCVSAGITEEDARSFVDDTFAEAGAYGEL